MTMHKMSVEAGEYIKHWFSVLAINLMNFFSCMIVNYDFEHGHPLFDAN